MFGEAENLREEAESMGFKELRTVNEVVNAFKAERFFFFINSDCPNSEYARKILSEMNIPENSYTVLAGSDMNATEKARELLNVKPSSPAFYMVEKGKVIFEMDRDDIIISQVDDVRRRLEDIFRQ